MQTLIKFIVTSFLIFIAGSWTSNCAAENENNLEIVPRRAPAASNIIVRLRDKTKGRSRADVLDRLGVVRRPLGRRTGRAGTKSKLEAHLPDLTVVRFNNDREVDAALAALRKNPEVLYAEPDYKVRIQLNSAGRVPNDFEFGRQIGLLNDGSHGTKTNADIQAAIAWRTAIGSRNVIVAVIDTGIDYYHPDLALNVWTNSKEIPGNGIDDDDNGFVDDLHGFDFVGKDSDPFDDNEHGSHVSGIIGAAGNNGIGIAGVCWEVSLMSLKAFGPDGSANLSDVLDAIDYAVENGANIINASWGLDIRSLSLEDAVMSAEKAGVLFIAAAGNDRTESPFYPAAYTGVISVAATDAFDQRASFSNFGTNITVAAPGQDIYSTVPNASYAYLSGTSMAAPHVSGLAALILSEHPDFSGEEIRDIIINTADPLQTDHPLGRGRINAASALQSSISLPKLAMNIPATLDGTFNLQGSAFGVQFKHFSLSVAVGKTGTNFVTVSEGTEAVKSGLLATNIDSNAFPDGPCIFKLEAENAEGGKASLFAPSSIANTDITEPLSNDILRAGELLDIRGRVPAGTHDFRIEYAPGFVPSVWTTVGIQLATKEEQLSGILARWDTSMVSSNEFYTLRLTVEDGKTTGRANFVYLDRHLRPGWPKRNPIRGDSPIEDWRNVVAADLDGDGQKEIILVDPGTDTISSQLLVYKSNGDLLWSRSLGVGSPYYDVPTTGDLNGDGVPEVIVDVAGKLFVFQGNGEPLPGWPVTLESPNTAKVVADLRQDGENEIIAYSQNPITKFGMDWRELTVFDHGGRVIRSWNIPFCSTTNDAPKLFPAVANLDDDPELEIVAQTGCNNISAYKLSSSRNPIWSANITGLIVASPVIGDIDHDGTNDIIVATEPDEAGLGGGLYRFDAGGRLQRGWPVLVGEALRATPSLGDLDGDGLLEISFPGADSWKLHLIQADGFEADGWPIPIDKVSSSASTVIGDVDGDGAPDVVIDLPGYMGLAISNNDPAYIGGIRAWNFHGEPILLNGPGRNLSFPVEGSSAPLWSKAAAVTLTDLDNDGFLDLIATSIQERSYSVGSQGSRLKNRNGIYVWNLGIRYRPETLPWPEFQQNSRHTGVLPPVTAKPGIAKPLRQRLITWESRPLDFPILLDSPFLLEDFTQPTNGIVGINDQFEFVYKPSEGFHGLDGFNYTLSDGETNQTILVSILVKGRNHLPVLTNQVVELSKNTSTSIFFQPGDPNGPRLTYKVSKPAEYGELWVSPGVATYIPNKGFSGRDSFMYTASDNVSSSEPALVSITVVETNNPPQSVNSNLRVRSGKLADFQLQARDIDGDPLTFWILSSPTHGNLIGGPVDWSYLSTPGYIGSDKLQFMASDGMAVAEPAEITFDVTDTNSAPIAMGQVIYAQTDRLTEIVLSGSDSENERLTFHIRDQPGHGTLAQQENHVTYVPNSSFTGPDRFTFSALDSESESDPAVVELYITRLNRLPVTVPQHFSGTTNQPIQIALAVTDPDRDPINCVILNGPQHGRIWGSGTKFVYMPNLDFGGNDSFSFQPWDGIGYGSVATVLLNVTPESPLSLPYFDSIRVMESGGVELTILQKPGQATTIESSADTYTWDFFARTEPGTNSVRLIDTNRFQSTRFYRATSAP